MPDGAFQKDLERIGLHWLFEIPECFEIANRGQRLFHAAECRQHDRRSVIAALVQVPDQLESVHARHQQIRNNDVCVEGVEPFERFQSVCGNLCLEASIGENSRQRGTLAVVIIYD